MISAIFCIVFFIAFILWIAYELKHAPTIDDYADEHHKEAVDFRSSYEKEKQS